MAMSLNSFFLILTRSLEFLKLNYHKLDINRQYKNMSINITEYHRGFLKTMHFFEFLSNIQVC